MEIPKEFTDQVAAEDRDKASRSIRNWVLIAGVVLLSLLTVSKGCSTYSTLNESQQQVQAELSNIDVQLARRADLLPNLVVLLQGYLKHEKQIFKDIADARNLTLMAQSPSAVVAADVALTGAVNRVLVLAQNTPAIKADAQVQAMIAEVSGTENRISVARRDFNLRALKYNTTLGSIVGKPVGSIFGFKQFEYFRAAEASKEVPQLKLE